MSKKEVICLSKDQIAVINKTLSNGDRVEVIPTKEGARIVKVIRRNMRLYAEDSESV